MSVFFTVHGRPQPAGSKRAFVNPKTGKVIVTDAAKGSRAWKQEVAGEAIKATAELNPDGFVPFDGPVELEVVYNLARPKSHFRTGAKSNQLRDDAPHWHTGKPDALKLTRAIEDAMTGIVYRDDSQVARSKYVKVYAAPGMPECASVLVRTMR